MHQRLGSFVLLLSAIASPVLAQQTLDLVHETHEGTSSVVDPGVGSRGP